MTICSMCGGSTAGPNFAKTVDPPNPPYGTILGNSPQRNIRGQRNACIPIQMCLPQLTSPQPSCGSKSGGGGGSQKLNAIVNVPCDPPKPCHQIFCEPCPPPPPTKVWLIKSSPMPQKSFAIAQPPPCHPCNRPIVIPCRPYSGSSSGRGSSPGTTMICLPCASIPQEHSKPKKTELTPIGIISRAKEFDLIGGKIIAGCSCGRRNGLGGDNCRRISCQNNPGCKMQPPRCWPQIPDPEPNPPPPPKQDIICLPIELVYCDPGCKK